jgi:crotonobetainyl-CoA:carnitine CoA-transferase CaiB-like acyl-CoA transferase
LARADLADDEGLATVSGRARRHDELDAANGSWTSRQPACEVEAALLAEGIPAAVVLIPAQMYADPQLDAVGYYQRIAHPVTGERRYPGWAAHHSDGPATAHRFTAPTLGQHNEEILVGELGLGPDVLQSLRERGLVGEQLIADS